MVETIVQKADTRRGTACVSERLCVCECVSEGVCVGGGVGGGGRCVCVRVCFLACMCM